MAENNRVQLNREEVVGNEVVLTEIAPKTNTESVDDDAKGTKLSQTLDKIWNDINNKLSRVVNSVNGRSGVVVLTPDDVGLGNVDNISFDEIKRWVIQRLKQEFKTHSIKLFASLDVAADFANSHGESYDGTPFWCDTGYTSENDYRAQVGYFVYDDQRASLGMEYVPVSTVGATDNSLAYNVFVSEDKDFTGGRLGVNIWKYEDALKLYDATAYGGPGDPSTPASLEASGLYIDKDVLQQGVYLYNDCYGDGTASDTSAFLYLENATIPSDAVRARIFLDNVLLNQNYVYVRNENKLKKNDIIVCNFDDSRYRQINGSLKEGINTALVCKQFAIGKVANAPAPGSEVDRYDITFYTLKPYIGHGLGYRTMSSPGDQEYPASPDTQMIGVELASGFSDGLNEVNTSGLNAFSDSPSSDTALNPRKTHHVVTPSGDEIASQKLKNNGLYVSTNFSMCVIPYGRYSLPAFAPIRNLPLTIPTMSSVEDPSFIGVNLTKQIKTLEYGGDPNYVAAFNMSGLRINTDQDDVDNEWLGKSDNDEDDKLEMPIKTSGGISINVGKFLEIGGGIVADTVKNATNYYDYGKVNVRVDNDTIGDVGDNTLGVKVSHYKKYDQADLNNVLGGGLTFSPGFYPENPASPLQITQGLTINRGLGLRMSHYDRFGNIPQEYTYEIVIGVDDGQGGLTWPSAGTYYHKEGDNYVITVVTGDGTVESPYSVQFVTGEYYTREHHDIVDYGFLATSVVDSQQCPEDFDASTATRINNKKMMYGGLRYIVGPDDGPSRQSAIALRVNDLNEDYGHELRLGSKAIGIDENNIVGVQLYRETDSPVNDINPLNIKGWDEFSLYKYIEMPWIKYSVSVNTETALNNAIDNRSFTDYKEYYEYKPVNPVNDTWPGPGVYYYKDGNSYVEITVGGKGTTEDPYVPPYQSGKYFTRTDITPNYIHRDDTVYYVKDESRRFIWNTTTNAYEPMFIYTTEEHLDEQDAHKSKVYVTQRVDNVEHKIFCGMYQYQDEYKVHLPFSYDPETHTYSDSEPRVNAVTSSAILSYYAKISVEHKRGYLIGDRFYYGPTIATGIMDCILGETYEDLSSPYPHMLYEWAGGEVGFRTWHRQDGHDITWEDLLPCDLNGDGYINSIDSSLALSFYAIMSSSSACAAWFPDLINDPTATQRDYLAEYLRLTVHLEERDAGYRLIRESDRNGSFMPGLDIDINEYQGITTMLNGDIKKAVSLKIYDESAGYHINDKYAHLKRGGLRFTTEGFVSVRVNNTSTYNATTPEGRGASDMSGQTKDGNSTVENGAKGLMIYSDNVVGVQLSTGGAKDNGELAFDEFGSLHISPSYSGGGGGGGQKLTIVDGDSHQVEYNGSSAVTLTLGPGLALEIEPDPTPNT